MTNETRIKSVIVLPKNAPIYSASATIIEIENEAAGEFIKVTQQYDSIEPGTILLEPDDWPAIRSAINKLMKSLREEKEQSNEP